MVNYFGSEIKKKSSVDKLILVKYCVLHNMSACIDSNVNVGHEFESFMHKSRLYTLVLSLALLAVNLVSRAEGDDNTDVNQAFMQSYFDCFNSKDFECLSSIFAEDVLYEGEYWVLNGQQEFFAFYRKAWQHFNEHISVVSVRTASPFVYVHLKNRIEVFADFPDFPARSLAAGDVMNLEGEVVYFIEDGKIKQIDDK